MPIIPFFCWLLLIWLCGWILLPLSRRLWRNILPDGGLAVGRVLGLCLYTLLAFWLGRAGIPTRISAWIIFPVFLAGAVWLWRERHETRLMLRENRRAIFAGEVIFFAAFFAFFLLRGFWPGTDNGEKPMDMALISACARAEFLPPPNVYVSGARLYSYYYFGHLQTALLSHAIFSEPRWTYNLMCATLPALVFSSLFSLCAALTGRLRLGFFATLGVLCLGTLEPLRLVFPAVFGPPQSDLSYFATSRVIPFTINEYPFFTFAFADLHAHFFAMPLAVLTMCCAWTLWNLGASGARSTRAGVRKSFAVIVICGLVLGALMMTNIWDFPLYSLLVLLATWRGFDCLALKIKSGFVLMLTAIIAAAPFWWQLQSSASKLHFIAPSSPVVAWFLMWGLFVTVLFCCLVFRNREESNFCWLPAACGVLALVWSEIAWAGFMEPPFHRQDMVFKFGLQAWYLLGTAVLCLAFRQYSQQRWPRFLPLLFAQLVMIMLWSSALVVQGRAQDFQEWQGLDAWAQLDNSEKLAAQWLLQNTRKQDFLLEAEARDGGDYTEYSRYAHATGIPIVIGPQAHAWQWLGNWDEVLQRKREVRNFYTTHNIQARLRFLRKYNVRYIVCGDLERREYGDFFVARVEKSMPVAARFGNFHDARRVVICHNPLFVD